MQLEVPEVKSLSERPKKNDLELFSLRTMFQITMFEIGFAVFFSFQLV